LRWDGSKGFIIVNAFMLTVAVGDEVCLVPCDVTIFVLFCFEDEIGVDDVCVKVVLKG